MALQTPRQRGLQRPSLGKTNTASSPNLSASAAGYRKESLRALTGQSGASPSTPKSSNMDTDLEVGDSVNVPGEMYGTVKFIGSVRGKSGRFVGVELDGAFAARGKNDGDVDGVHYFQTTNPGAGIFLPVHRAEKRTSPGAVSLDSFPATPNTPSHSNFTASRQPSRGKGNSPPSSMFPPKSKFSQTVGPGARPPSPLFKSKRPSLPRPDSPFKSQPSLKPTPARQFSQSVRGNRPGAAPTTSTTPSKPNFRSSVSGRTPQPSRPYSRTGSRLGHRSDTINEDDRTPVGAARGSNGRHPSSQSVSSYSQAGRSPSRLGSAGGQDSEIRRLREELAERDQRLEEQAASLSEMEASVKELSSLMPEDGGLDRESSIEGGESVGQLRQALREKNEKISILTAEFDQHRADFRSTLDSLEMASTETERVYEEQKRDLLAQLNELQEMSHSREDVETVANQLKQLEELVAELEEGLEESRRGEAEARGEVEFLRGEVERGRSELRREREKAAAVMQNGEGSRDMDAKDDEIRGLKAIVQNLSSSPGGTTPANNASDGDEFERLQAAFEESQREKEALEKELEDLRRDSAYTNGNGNTNASDSTATGEEKDLPLRDRADTIKPSSADRMRQREADTSTKISGEDPPIEESTGPQGDDIYCEMCESRDHDTLDCQDLRKRPKQQRSESNADEPTDFKGSSGPGKENKASGKTATAVDEDKWCALCEKDGHLAFDCPEEQY